MKHLGSPITTVPKLSQNVKLEDQEGISEDPMECSLGDQDAKVQCHVYFSLSTFVLQFTYSVRVSMVSTFLRVHAHAWHICGGQRTVSES